MSYYPLLLPLFLPLSVSSVGEAAQLRAGAMFGGGGGASSAEPGDRGVTHIHTEKKREELAGENKGKSDLPKMGKMEPKGKRQIKHNYKKEHKCQVRPVSYFHILCTYFKSRNCDTVSQHFHSFL